MPEIDLQNVYAAIAVLEQKYPQLVFTPNFERTISGTRGIFDIHISRANDSTDAWTHSMIVPNNMATVNDYVQNTAVFLEPRFGTRT